MPVADTLLPSSATALGALWDGRGAHFAVFAEDAEAVELCLFDARGEECRLQLPDCTNGIWRGYLPRVQPGQRYGYRVYGPYDPQRGHRFNPHKLLIDPYARQLAGALRWNKALYGYRMGGAKADLVPDRTDSARYLPKAVLVDASFDWGNDRAPRTPWSDTVIYELHVKGFTQRFPGLGDTERGSFGALGDPAVIDYLRRLGVTAVELLPIHAFARDHHLLDQGLTNYWGYNTLSYFAPEPAYLSDGTLGQIKWAVRELHAAGIEVILDVVYNHTCEGSELGPTLSWRGFGNASYYRLLPDNARYHINDTGCGNTVNFSHPAVIRMVMDSLRYWVQEFHVDGFRFDLGVTLGREVHGFDPGCGFFDALLQDPLLARVKLISEPWDIGPGGYQIGQHPAGMAEWNGRFRDDVRCYWRSDDGLRSALAARLQGSAELFDHHRRKPWASVNFITAHDGFTLRDLVSYNDKHNEANGEDNRDGGNDNASCNWGCEGPTDDVIVNDARLRVSRSLLMTLFFSHGTPMLLAGDEFGQTQAGNNNVYCQDNELSWLDWERAATGEGRALRTFVERLIRLRRSWPLLQGLYFQHGHHESDAGLRDVFWFDERGVELIDSDWHNVAARLLGLRRAARRADGRLDVLVLLHNADGAGHTFRLPPPLYDFRVLIDSAHPELDSDPVRDGRYVVSPNTCVLLAGHQRREPLPDEVAVESAALAVAGAAPVDAISDPPDGPIDPAPLPPPEPAPDPAPEPWPEPVPDPVPEPRPQPVPDPAPEPPPRPWPDPAPEPQPEPLPGFDDPGPLPVPA